MKRYRRLFWFIGAIAAGLLIPAWFALGLLDGSYVDQPRTPHPELGLVVPYATKGVTVYISQTQLRVVTWLFWFDVCMVAVVAACFVLSGGKLGPQPPNSN
jgi:hypothetical protein